MKYRPEIDGLRALAVLPVILYHAGFMAISGGFVGVDVFFVISGYLITALLLTDLEAGTYSIAAFYARRARRILPALSVVMLVSIPVAYAVMLPSQLLDFSYSLIAVGVFLSNVFFWRESGYFAPDASEMPLLHTWSLGVEEQFYVLFPLLLALLWRYRKRWLIPAMLLLLIGSLIACELASHVMPSANFYLLPTRAWELLVGALAALLPRKNTPAPPWISLVGLALLLLPMVTYDDQMRLPSLWMLVPVLGTALVLRYATAGTWAARLLTLRPLVAIGLISYSAYLWHHPLFAFARIIAPAAPTALLMGGLCLVTLVLAALSWRYVEQPFRQKSHPHYVRNRRAWGWAVLAAVLPVLVAAVGIRSQGQLEAWQARAQPAQLTAYRLSVEAKKRPPAFDDGKCIFLTETLTKADQERLIACHATHGPGIALIGDSHGMNLFGKLHARIGKPFVVGIARGMCRPHSPNSLCYYDELLALLKRNPQLFSHIFYEQAGWHLLARSNGKPANEPDLHGLPLAAPMPDFMPNTDYIAAVKTYLVALSAYARVTWIGAHLEPQIREAVMVRLGCDYPYALRENQAAQYTRLEAAIEAALAGSPIRYHSQIADLAFEMPQDFITCDALYFSDTNHFSAAGEKQFGARLRLDRLLKGE